MISWWSGGTSKIGLLYQKDEAGLIAYVTVASKTQVMYLIPTPPPPGQMARAMFAFIGGPTLGIIAILAGVPSTRRVLSC
jgi:hypothetical protein